MTKWLQSGRRRDVCFLLYEAGELPRQRLKTALERHYDERIEPKSFNGALDAMADAGFVESRVEGLADVFSLTDAGEARVEEHYAWVRECMGEAGDADAGANEGGDANGTEDAGTE